jgi:hypothetical protein
MFREAMSSAAGQNLCVAGGASSRQFKTFKVRVKGLFVGSLLLKSWTTRLQ